VPLATRLAKSLDLLPVVEAYFRERRDVVFGDKDDVRDADVQVVPVGEPAMSEASAGSVVSHRTVRCVAVASLQPPALAPPHLNLTFGASHVWLKKADTFLYTVASFTKSSPGVGTATAPGLGAAFT